MTTCKTTEILPCVFRSHFVGAVQVRLQQLQTRKNKRVVVGSIPTLRASRSQVAQLVRASSNQNSALSFWCVYKKAWPSTTIRNQETRSPRVHALSSCFALSLGMLYSSKLTHGRQRTVFYGYHWSQHIWDVLAHNVRYSLVTLVSWCC